MDTNFTTVFALYPRVTQLDFTGPYEVLAHLPGARTVLASVTGGCIEAEGGISFGGILRLADLERCDLLCVPGGFGTLAAMEDEAFLGEIERLARRASWVTSVCTGSLLLGAAGMLVGRRAACHWASRDLLAIFGAIPDSARVVRDGHIWTGGGVTAGIDLALGVVGEIQGRDFAEAVQLGIEYAPAPPFEAGRPETARPEILAGVTRRFDAVRALRDAACRRVAARRIHPVV